MQTLSFIIATAGAIASTSDATVDSRSILSGSAVISGEGATEEQRRDAAPTPRPIDDTSENDTSRTTQSRPLASDPPVAKPPAQSDRAVFRGGKLLLTNGITSLEGASGGGIAKWATIAGLELERGIGASGHATFIELPDFGWRSYGVSLGVGDRVELSFTRQNFDTRDAGAALGLGEGYTFNQDIYGAKVRVAGDVVYGSPAMPQIALGVEYKRNLDGPIVDLLGAGDDEGFDFTLSATKLVLEHSILINATARLTEANQLGLLGFGNSDDRGHRIEVEGSLAYQLTRRAAVGVELRTKPDNLGLGEDDWLDVFIAYAPTRNLTVSAAYVDLGSIATFDDQRGGFLQTQIAF